MINVEELRQNSIPLTATCAGVYFLFQDEQLVHIGQSWNCLLGVAEKTRKESTKVFNKWNFVPMADENERNQFVAKLRAEYSLKPSSA